MPERLIETINSRIALSVTQETKAQDVLVPRRPTFLNCTAGHLHEFAGFQDRLGRQRSRTSNGVQFLGVC